MITESGKSAENYVKLGKSRIAFAMAWKEKNIDLEPKLLRKTEWGDAKYVGTERICTASQE